MSSELSSSEPNESDRSNGLSFALVGNIVKLLEPLTTEEQTHVLQTVITWLHLQNLSAPSPQSQRATSGTTSVTTPSDDYPYSGRAEVAPKEFMLEKDPKSDLERLTCLAYYLTHYRNLAHFKTEDLTKLNMEAAQPRFSNAAYTAKNAVRDGYFVPAPKKGHRQLSALGEQYVQALPNHEAAREVRKRMGNRSRRSRAKNNDRGNDAPPQPEAAE